MDIVAIIPARYEAVRLPGKPLLDIDGRPVIQHVYVRTARAKRISRVIVATDDRRIFDAVEGFGGEAVMTSPDHPSGTDRIAEVATGLDAEIIVNVQGDEALIDPRMIDQAVEPLLGDAEISMATVATRISGPEELNDPNVVKVVVDRRGLALYFSRCPIPFVRDDRPDSDTLTSQHFLHHIGLYVYRRDFLLRFAELSPTPLERIEKLEQLRALENGYRIAVTETPYSSIGVDTPEDLARVRRIVAERARRQEAGGRRQEAGGRRQEAGGRRQEAGGRRQEAGDRRQRTSFYYFLSFLLLAFCFLSPAFSERDTS